MGLSLFTVGSYLHGYGVVSTAHASIRFAFLGLPSEAYMCQGPGAQALRSTLDTDGLQIYLPRSESNNAIDDKWLTHTKQRGAPKTFRHQG